MKHHRLTTGFTLLEILVALAIMALIVTAVYGTYQSAAQSARKCQARQTSRQQGWSLLAQIARQIRCSCLPPAFWENQDFTGGAALVNNNSQIRHPLFEGSSDSHRGNLLHLATTSPLMPDPDTGLGIYEVAYRLDNNHTLYYQQRLLTPQSDSVKKNNSWIAIADDIDAIELAFFDGNRWRDNWSSDQDSKFPQAVKLKIVFNNDSNRDAFNTTTMIPTTVLRGASPENTVSQSNHNIMHLIRNK